MSLQELKYSSVDGVDIYIDYIVPESASAEKPAPIFLWFHGGGLLQGTRKGPPHHWASAPSKHGLCVVSADYRLAPQVRFPAIMADCKALMDCLRGEAFKKATGGRVDQSRICISGGSAGGWLALLVGMGIGFEACGIEPPAPSTSIAALYPISDLNDPFWHTKSYPASCYHRVIKDEEVKEFVDPSSKVLAASAGDGPRSIFYHYMVQEAILNDLLLSGTNIDPTAFSVADAIKSGKAATPPTYVVHGDADRAVPVVQGDDVVNALKEKGCEVVYERPKGLDHLYDRDEKYQMEEMYAFVKRTLGVA